MNIHVRLAGWQIGQFAAALYTLLISIIIDCCGLATICEILLGGRADVYGSTSKLSQQRKRWYTLWSSGNECFVLEKAHRVP